MTLSSIYERTLVYSLAIFSILAGASALATYISMNTIALPLNLWVVALTHISLFYCIGNCRSKQFRTILCFIITAWSGFTTSQLFGIFFEFKVVPIMMLTYVSVSFFMACMSAYAMITRSEFTFMSGFITSFIMTTVLSTVSGIIFSFTLLDVVSSMILVMTFVGIMLNYVSEVYTEYSGKHIELVQSFFIAIYKTFANLIEHCYNAVNSAISHIKHIGKNADGSEIKKK